jgi:hypothetical protein
MPDGTNDHLIIYHLIICGAGVISNPAQGVGAGGFSIPDEIRVNIVSIAGRTVAVTLPKLAKHAKSCQKISRCG